MREPRSVWGIAIKCLARWRADVAVRLEAAGGRARRARESRRSPSRRAWRRGPSADARCRSRRRTSRARERGARGDARPRLGTARRRCGAAGGADAGGARGRRGVARAAAAPPRRHHCARIGKGSRTDGGQRQRKGAGARVRRVMATRASAPWPVEAAPRDLRLHELAATTLAHTLGGNHSPFAAGSRSGRTVAPRRRRRLAGCGELRLRGCLCTSLRRGFAPRLVIA